MTTAWGVHEAKAFVHAPRWSDDKYSRGVVGLLTGSALYPGAAVLSVSGAWRAGAGLVRWAGDAAVGRAVLAARPETVVRAGRADAWVIGSGFDDDAVPRDTEVHELLGGSAAVVADAGAIDVVDSPNAPTVITPHAREFVRLAAARGIDLTGERETDVCMIAAALGVVVLLKGADTLIATPGGAVRRVTSGTPWLATAGTGDVLAGIMGSLIAQQATRGSMTHEVLADTAATAAVVHGLAALIASGEPAGPITALDVAEATPRAIAALLAL